MIEIPNTTLCCIDCINYELSIRAIKHSLKQCRFDRTLFISDREYNFKNIDTLNISPITTKEQYSRFVIKELNRYISTDFVLMIQYDGFIINPGAWTPEFMQYDYTGAKWWYKDGFNVGNGGFSLRSKKLFEALNDKTIQIDSVEHGEDTLICRTYRRFLEKEYGIKFAPESVADKFSYERSEPVNNTFGFHGLFHMWRYLRPEDLKDFMNELSETTLDSIEAIELGINYHRAERVFEAEIIYRKILEYYPDHQNAKSLLRKIQNAKKIDRIGRNEPCPCGSKKKYKKCCGGIE